MPTGTITITFMDNTVWTFTNCTNIQTLADPDRLSFNGTKDSTTALWIFPFANIRAWSQS